MTGEHVYYAHLVHDRTGTEASEVWRETAHGKSRIIPALSPAQAGTVAAALNTAFAAAALAARSWSALSCHRRSRGSWTLRWPKGREHVPTGT